MSKVGGAMPDAAIPSYRVFISSPRDVMRERERALLVMRRLNGEFEGEFQLRPIAWEEETYSARNDFQRQIAEATKSDIVIGMLWARAGQALDPSFYRRADGSIYESGTIYEIETALEHLRQHGRPEVVLFFKQADPPMGRGEAGLEDQHQRNLVDAVIKRWTLTEEGHSKRAFNAFATESAFEEKFEHFLRKWLETQGVDTSMPVWRSSSEDSPFPGLEPYEARLQPVFFGRGSAVRLCTDALRAADERGCGFLLVVGASGAGKSSLARAGLVPRLAMPGSIHGVNAWRQAQMRPGETPLATLALELFRAIPELAETTDANNPADWAQRAEADQGFAKTSLDLLPADQRLLLLVDQLEEAFIAKPDGFALALDALARSGKALVIATLRADRYGALQGQERLLRLKLDGASYDLSPPGEDEFGEIIRGPVRVAKLKFERRDKDGSLSDVLQSALGGTDALPLLQATLAQLFEKRNRATAELTFAAYEEIGGLNGAISRHADKALDKLSEAERKELRPLLLALTSIGPGGEYLGRPISRGEFETGMARQALVASLLNERLIVADSGDELRVAHEALLRNWGAAREILHENRVLLRVRATLESVARDWIVAGQMRQGLLAPGHLLSEAESVLPQLREMRDAAALVAFVEASLENRARALRTIRTRLAGDDQKILGHMKARQFREAESDLAGVVRYLSEQTDPELEALRNGYETKWQRIRRLAAFYTAAEETDSLAGEEDFGKAPGRCEEALRALGVFDDPEWFDHLPATDLDPEQVEQLKQDAYRTLLLYGGLQLVPGIVALRPKGRPGPPRPKPVIDPARLLKLVPRFVLSAILRSGGIGKLRLPGRLDRPEALAVFRKSGEVLSRVRQVEERLAVERDEIPRASRSSHLMANLGEMLSEFASGPRDAPIDYGRWMSAASRDPRPEPVNAADYFFIGLFNYFVAKRRDGSVAKLVSLMQGRFPDLDTATPLASAERLLRAAIALEPRNFWAHWILGRTLLTGEDHPGAELAFNAAIVLRPGYARGFEQRALALAYQWLKSKDDKLRQRALIDSARAMAVADGDPSVFWPRGELLELLGQTRDALDAYSRWLELEEDILAMISRGTGVARLYELANVLLRRADVARSEGAELLADAHALLALVHLTWTNDEEALREAESALHIAPQHPHALTAKGMSLCQAGRPSQALPPLDLALDRDPLNYRAALHRARALEAIAADAAALQAWQDLAARSAASSGHRSPRWMLLEAEAGTARLLANGRPQQVEAAA